MEFHPLSEIFPLMEDDDLFNLGNDIARNGVREPIVLYEGKILDGRSRMMAYSVNQKLALEKFGLKLIPPSFVTYEGDDPVGCLVSLNLESRKLSISQRAMVAAKLIEICGRKSRRRRS
jgi:hypothetical protein